VTYCLDVPNSLQIIGAWLHDWQTLISGLLALAAAWWAGSLLNRQTQQSEILAAEQLQRQHNAARAALPLALSAVLDYCQKTADDIAGSIESIANNQPVGDETQQAPPQPFGKHTISENVIQLFYKFIESLNEESEAKHVGELISRIQVLKSRFDGIHKNNLSDPNSLYGLLLDCATIKFLAESLFNYARFVDNASFAKVGVTGQQDAWNGIQQAAQGLIFERPRIDLFANEIANQIGRRQKAGLSPWLEKFEV
jgi:hypothetical protein